MKKTNFKPFLLPLFVMALMVIVNTTSVKAAIFTNPTQIGFGEKKYAIQPAETDVYFKFTTTADNAYYSFTGSVISGGSRYFDVYSGGDTTYSHESLWVGNDDNNNMVLKTMPNHTYYIVSRGTWNPSEVAVQVNKVLDDAPNDFGTAVALGLGQSRDGVLEVDSDVDFYKFTTSSRNSFYEVSLGATGSETVKAYIYDGGDASYHKTEMWAYSGSTDSNVYTYEKNHTYYIKVYGRTRYKISVKEILDDAADDFKGASKMTNKVTKFGKIHTDKDEDIFKFKTAKKKAAYQFTVKNTSTSYIYVTVYSRGDIASAITQVNKYYVGSAGNYSFWLNLRKNHTYYVKVYGGANATYKLNFTDSQTAIKNTAPKDFKATGCTHYSYSASHANLSWRNDSKFAGYEIWRSKHKGYGYKKIKTIKDTSYYNDTGLKRRTTYYYKIRYYVRDNGKTYGGKWSAAKKVRIN